VCRGEGRPLQHRPSHTLHFAITMPPPGFVFTAGAPPSAASCSRRMYVRLYQSHCQRHCQAAPTALSRTCCRLTAAAAARSAAFWASAADKEVSFHEQQPLPAPHSPPELAQSAATAKPEVAAVVARAHDARTHDTTCPRTLPMAEFTRQTECERVTRTEVAVCQGASGLPAYRPTHVLVW